MAALAAWALMQPSSACARLAMGTILSQSPVTTVTLCVALIELLAVQAHDIAWPRQASDEACSGPTPAPARAAMAAFLA